MIWLYERKPACGSEMLCLEIYVTERGRLQSKVETTRVSGQRERQMERCFSHLGKGPLSLERKATTEGKLTRDSHFLPPRLKTCLCVCVNG